MSYNFSRDLSFNGNTGYNKMTSLGFASGAFTGWTAGGGVTYKLTESFGLNARYDWRTFDLRQTTFGRTANRVTIGITYFPQQGPAGLW
jgi:opacity protein-like surface antigen